jgi:hypothetical protein
MHIEHNNESWNQAFASFEKLKKSGGFNTLRRISRIGQFVMVGETSNSNLYEYNWNDENKVDHKGRFLVDKNDNLVSIGMGSDITSGDDIKKDRIRKKWRKTGPLYTSLCGEWSHLNGNLVFFQLSDFDGNPGSKITTSEWYDYGTDLKKGMKRISGDNTSYSPTLPTDEDGGSYNIKWKIDYDTEARRILDESQFIQFVEAVNQSLLPRR